MMYCAECDENLDDVPVDSPCPSCGSARRSAKTTGLLTVGVIAMAGEVGLKVTRGSQRPWTDKWFAVLHCLEQLQNVYQVRVGTQEAEQHAASFFSECYHVRDWLEHNHLATRADIQAHIDRSRPLTKCAAICNTHKHHTRARATDITARIHEIETMPTTGTRITYEFRRGTGRRTRVDALHLAEQCIKAWRTFFKKHNISEP
jgi:hypothetical protein